LLRGYGSQQPGFFVPGIHCCQHQERQEHPGFRQQQLPV
jgi:hypothetical protein